MNAYIRIIPALLLLICISTSLQAQLRETFHNVYMLDEIETVEIDVTGDVQFLKWDGKTLMVETIVELGNANKGMMRYLIQKKKRYDLKSQSSNKTLTVESTMKERQALITQNGSCDEYVGVIFYVPQDYNIVNDNLLEKGEEEEAEPAAEATTGDE